MSSVPFSGFGGPVLLGLANAVTGKQRGGFDWLKEYGPQWSPECKAFWLEPRTKDELRAWFRKYRPGFTGKVTAAGMTVEIVSPPALPTRAGAYTTTSLWYVPRSSACAARESAEAQRKVNEEVYREYVAMLRTTRT